MSCLTKIVALGLATVLVGCTGSVDSPVADPSGSSVEPSPTQQTNIVHVPRDMVFSKANRRLWSWAGRLPAGDVAKVSYVSRGHLVVNGRSVVYLAPVEERGGSLLGVGEDRWFVTMTGGQIVAVDRDGSVVQEYPTFPRSSPNHGHDLIVSPDGRLMIKDQRLIRTRDAQVIGRTPRDVYTTVYWTKRAVIYKRINGSEYYRAWRPGKKSIKVPTLQYSTSGFGVETDRKGCFTGFQLTPSDATQIGKPTCEKALVPHGVPEGRNPLDSPYLSNAGLIVDSGDLQPLRMPRRALYAMYGLVGSLWESDDSILLSVPEPSPTANKGGWGARIRLVRCPTDGSRCNRVPGKIQTADVSELFKMLPSSPNL